MQRSENWSEITPPAWRCAQPDGRMVRKLDLYESATVPP
jgi:hypothetical protein